jgi:rhamnogalacturonyl hydrolase YesR
MHAKDHSPSRRRFLEAGLAIGVAAESIIAPAVARPAVEEASATQSGPAATDDYLAAAKEAARWIRSAQVDKAPGIAWLPEPDHPEKKSTVGPDNTLYSGSAGVVLFFIELARASGSPAYLADAARGADYLSASWTSLREASGPAFFRDRGLSFDQGLAGTAFTLTETWKATGDQKYRHAALEATRALAAAAREVDKGLEWTASPAVGQGGGIILYLLYAANALGDPTLKQLAARGGDRIIQLAESDPRGGLRWQGLPPGSLNPSLSNSIASNSYFPNFELGTAGVAFVLARLYEETHEQRFLQAAREGARHIQSIATVRDDSALVYYREPDLKNLYYLGYCHGPAGTARLFYQLHKITGEAEYLEWTEKLARGIVRSGVPEKLTPGYWNVACQCCGSAAVTDFFLSLWLATGKAQYRDFAFRVADQLISREVNLDGKGYRWYQAWTRVKPWEVSAETGYKIGAAGIGAALIHTHLATRDRYQALLFPDNPFPRSQKT